ncbi:MAG: GPI inositol-deacylase [Burkholderiales bacterium]|nr:GPI inositol-deacylase [Burkholderiales bacterium]
MASRPASRRSDLRGAARLATDATTGLADLVEAMHERIARLPGREPAAVPGRTSGITGLVYKNVRGVARVVGGSIDALLGLLGPALGADRDPPSRPNAKREALVAALNGVLGDYLAATDNPLATPMALRRDGHALELEREALARRLPDAGGRLLVLAHGLCMGDLQWLRKGHDHGAALGRDLGYTPVYLQYNSGCHISLNGRAFARALERLIAQWPQPLERLAILGHSMGGLVARSALHWARLEGHRWPARLDDLVFLGTPHHGSPLERAGHWADVVLEATPYAAPFARLGKVRSAGITDLRHGNLVDEDWVGRDRFARRADDRQHLPLPDDVRCYAVAASLAAKGSPARRLGDGLVPLASALGRHRDPARALRFARDRQWVGYEMGHLDLLNHADVYARLRQWLA